MEFLPAGWPETSTLSDGVAHDGMRQHEQMHRALCVLGLLFLPCSAVSNSASSHGAFPDSGEHPSFLLYQWEPGKCFFYSPSFDP